MTLTTGSGQALASLERVRARDALAGAWQLTPGQLIGPTFAESKTLVGTLTFTSATRYAGQVGCNDFSGTYTADDSGAVTFDRPAITDVYCPLAPRTVGIADLIDQARGWTVDGTRLTLTGGSAGALTFQR